MEYLKEALRKACAFDDLIENIGLAEKHLNGYIYDSLIYRYKLAREKAMNYDLLMDRRLTGGNKEDTIRHEEQRDVMRFIEILDEIVGEHD